MSLDPIPEETSTSVGLPSAARTDPAPEIEGYVIERPLGHGGMGTVFLARDQTLDRQVALKLLPQRVTGDPEARRRFAREARALARIVHPNIVPIHAFGEADCGEYMVMAYVDGTSLREILTAALQGRGDRFARLFSRKAGREPLANLASARVARTVAEALDEIHQAGIVHRDVKPANVVIDSKGRPYLVDFGIACAPASGLLACDAISTGTLRYMPPEYLDGGADQVDPRSDLYSLGLMLFEMLTLAPAFPGDDLNTLLRSVTAGLSRFPRALNGSVSATLDRIVRRATARLPKDRFPSAQAMAEELRRAEHELAFAESLAGAQALGPQLEQALRRFPGSSLYSRLMRRLRACR